MVAVVAATTLAAVAPSPAVAQAPVAGTSGESPGWVGTWATADVAAAASGLSATGFADQTVREIVHATVGGSQVRIRLSNVFGAGPLLVDGVHVAVRDTGAAVQAGTDRQVTFSGAPTVTVPAGERAVSDPVTLSVSDGEDLAVSIYFRGASGPATWHQEALGTNYYSDGDHAADTDSAAYTQVTTSWFFLDGVDVLNSTVRGSVVAFGPSTTDGNASTAGANRRYPDDLARRLAALPSGQRMSVLNAGISGNQLLADGGNSGQRAIKRFERDVIEQTGVRAVIVWEGTNDIGSNPSINLEQITGAWQELIDMAHQHGIQVIGATLQPDQGAGFYTEAGNDVREAANQWMRTSGAFDAVVDYDRVLLDPSNPKRMLPAYDSGDHLHPNDDGYQAIANGINLQILTYPATASHAFSGKAYTDPLTLTVNPGSSAQATLFVDSWSNKQGIFQWTAAETPGLTISPDHGSFKLAPNEIALIQLTVTATSTTPAGWYPVTFNLTEGGHDALAASMGIAVGCSGSGTGSYACTTDSHGNVNNVYSCTAAQHNAPSLPTATIVNGCSARIWLHELPYPDYVTGGGYTYCVSPMAAVSIPGAYQAPKNIQVTTNQSPC